MSVRYPSEANGPKSIRWINIGAVLFDHHSPTRLLASSLDDLLTVRPISPLSEIFLTKSESGTLTVPMRGFAKGRRGYTLRRALRVDARVKLSGRERLLKRRKYDGAATLLGAAHNPNVEDRQTGVWK
jgi:hypothetical protein